MLKVRGLKTTVEGKIILDNLDFTLEAGEIHVLMGPNGSGKSTFAQVIAGHPAYKVIGGKLSIHGKDILGLTPDKRAKLGIFLGMQQPVEVPGVSLFNFLRKAKQSQKGVSKDPKFLSEYRSELKSYMDELKLPEDFLRRSLNEGFSGGEKKRNEILQMMALSPKLVILDEIDSGLDVDGLKLVAFAIARFKAKNPKSSIILITHYARILNYLKADFVHIMVGGKVVETGKMALAIKVEKGGYTKWLKEA